MRHGNRWLLLLPVLNLPLQLHGQTLTATFDADFSISQIGTNVGAVTQMAFAPGDDNHLYLSTFGNGILRYDYAPGASLSNPIMAVPAPVSSSGGVDGSLGIAFHQDPTLGLVMYLAPAVPFGGGGGFNELPLQSIVRLTDAGGNGVFGDEAEDVNQVLLNNVEVSLQHQINQLQVHQNTLFAAIGTRTSNGGTLPSDHAGDQSDPGETAYTGTVSFIEDLTQLSGDTTTVNLAGFDISNHKTDLQPFTSVEPGKLRVFSTGLRNNYGLGIDDEGQLWTSMNQQGPDGAASRPDELHQTSFQDDHGFPKGNDDIGDWKLNATAVAAGYFQNFVNPVSTHGSNASANGFDFLPDDFQAEQYRGNILISRYAFSDIQIVDPTNGAVDLFGIGFNRVLDLQRDPFGNILAGMGPGGNGGVYRIGASAVAGQIPGDVNGDGIVDDADVLVFIAGWMHVQEFGDINSLRKGDLNQDGKTDLFDWQILRDNHVDGSSLTLGKLIEVPELMTIEFVIIGLLSYVLCALPRITI